MIDFENDGLEWQVYELIAKLCDLASSDEFEHFQRKQIENGKWECRLTIPGVKRSAFGSGSTEVESINECALDMLMLLKREHNQDDYDPDFEESIFSQKIDTYFDGVMYNSEYKYHLCQADIRISEETIKNAKILEKYGQDIVEKIEECGDEIDQISQIVTVRLLVKKRKNNYC